MRARVLIALLLLVPAAPAEGDGGDAFQVIVNPRNPVKAIDRAFLRDAYLKQAAGWPDGEPVRPVDLDEHFPARDRFSRAVIRKSPEHLRSYWNQRIFSGKGVPPPAFDTVAAVITYVTDHAGAVGYLPPGVDAGGARVMPLDGSR
jgi:hypothetical protein